MGTIFNFLCFCIVRDIWTCKLVMYNTYTKTEEYIEK